MSTPIAHDAERLHAGFAFQRDLALPLFGETGLARLEQVLDLGDRVPVHDFADVGRSRLERLEVLITGWQAPRIGPRELELMPRLRAVFHAAGSVKGHLDPAVWDRGVLVTTAAHANALPVAEYTLGMILLAGKGIVPASPRSRSLDDPGMVRARPEVGNYRRTVGIVSASTVGRQVLRLLAAFDFEVLLYDPLLEPDDPILAFAQRVELPELLARSSVVSIHAPLLPATTDMIGATELALLPDDAVVINTARGAVVDQDALERELRAGRVRAVLDVTTPDPLPDDASLREAPGLLLTPHLAGALGNELRRLGQSVLVEVERFVAGEDAAFPVRKSDLAAMA